MATEKRERQRANRALKQQEQAKVERKSEIRDRGTRIAVLAGVALVGLGLLWFFTRGGPDEETETSPHAMGETETETEVPEQAVEPPEPGATIDGPTDCPAADGSAERVTQFSEAPPMCIDASKSYTAVLATTEGDITVELDASKAPSTVNNFVVLARYHFYDGTPFHRIIPGFVIQGGDAVGPQLGAGNPGYMIDEEPPDEGEYEIGSLAMAKGDGASSTGSQFFIITGEQGVALPAEYSLFGAVTAGMDAVEAIEALPTDAGDLPTEEIYIEAVTITES